MEMEKKTQKAVNDLFRLVSAEEITDLLSQNMSICLEHDNKETSEVAGKIYIETELINFLHRLNRIRLENQEPPAIS